MAVAHSVALWGQQIATTFYTVRAVSRIPKVISATGVTVLPSI